MKGGGGFFERGGGVFEGRGGGGCPQKILDRLLKLIIPSET